MQDTMAAEGKSMILDDRRRTRAPEFGLKEDSEYLVDERRDGTLVLTQP